ncbi:MAG: MBL fold metallo-hydrolase [Gammaproteobacteria bacterium]|nr:MBL fold metallo-hydrolase [Gammaproteobacteria bacterium]NNM00286.1 MBL fold metallo-hydrolase [Gammaproteobacteria bacterium]
MYEIHTLYVGELHVPHNGGIMRDPVHCWLVTDGEVRVLVDSGMPEIAEVTRSLKIGGKGGGHAALREALAKIDLTPEDVDFVVPTHLHFDHGSNLDLFPGACVVIQRDEVLHAIDAVPTQRIYYRRDTVSEIVNRKRPDQVRFIDGDYELLPGILLLKLPAHTPGMHVPIVQTERGKAALVSDLGDHYRFWFPADPRATKKPMRFMTGSFLPSGIRSGGELEFTAAMQRVLDHADIVVPAHDARIPKKMPEEWFAIPESTDGDISDMPIEP